MEFDPKKLEVRKLTQEDVLAFNSLVRLFNMVFEEDETAIGTETNLLKLLSNSHFVAMAAFYENEIAGGLTAYVLPMYYSENSEIFLYDLAVKPEYQRMGVGKRLIQSLKEYCVKNGINEFFVLAHEEDEHALEFYRSTGGKSEKVVNFIYEIADRHEQM
jgi:aminoglycoside 3-N-acetyltransferase I